MREAKPLCGLTPLCDVKRVGVGSTNPPKLAGVRAALRAYAPSVEVLGVAVESGVSDQPVGYDEIVRGARARALAAAGAEAFDLTVGYEDGLVRLPTGAAGAHADAWFNVGCAAVLQGDTFSLGFSSGFAYPAGCAERAAGAREPIGGLFDALWASQGRDVSSRAPLADAPPSSLGLGNVGKLTAGAIDRAEYTRHAVVCALAPFVHPDLYAPGDA